MHDIIIASSAAVFRQCIRACIYRASRRLACRRGCKVPAVGACTPARCVHVRAAWRLPPHSINSRRWRASKRYGRARSPSARGPAWAAVASRRPRCRRRFRTVVHLLPASSCGGHSAASTLSARTRSGSPPTRSSSPPAVRRPLLDHLPRPEEAGRPQLPAVERTWR